MQDKSGGLSRHPGRDRGPEEQTGPDAGPSVSLRQHLVRGAFGSLALKMSITVLTLALTVILARILGVAGFGVYAFCISVAQVLTVPAMLGGQIFLIREVAAYNARGDFSRLRGLLSAFRRAVFLSSAVLVLLAAGIGFQGYRSGPMLTPFLIALGLVPLLAAMQLQGAVLQGLRRVLLGQTAQTLRPILVIALIGILFWHGGRVLSPAAAVSAQVAGTALLVAVFYMVLRRSLPEPVRHAEPVFELSRWKAGVLPFVFAGSMQILNNEMPVILLGIMQTHEEVALFRVAQKGALLIPFGLYAVNAAIAPTLSELFSRGEKQRLQAVVAGSMPAILAFAVPTALFLVISGSWLLPLVFGAEYRPAYIPLVILCAGQLVNAGLGSVSLILNMAGLERLTARGVAIAAVAGLVANLLLIPHWGAVGAAVATSGGLILWNVLLAIWLYRETGIVTVTRPTIRSIHSSR